MNCPIQARWIDQAGRSTGSHGGTANSRRFGAATPGSPRLSTPRSPAHRCRRVAAAGFPAVCVGAGPSLSRNLALLANPETRRRLVVITAQTTLKPLLACGIRPDFVTALDYHHISTRFYEGLDELPDQETSCAIAESWRPYASVGSWYCWRSLDVN